MSTFLVFTWSRRLFGKASGILATALFTTLPPILAHSGLATSDQAVTATLFFAVFSFLLWLERPSVGRSCLLGITSGLAFLSKFSALVFLPFCGLSISVLKCIHIRVNKKLEARASSNGWLKGCAITILLTFTVVWRGYRFSTEPLVTPEMRPHILIDQLVGVDGALHDNIYRIMESPIFPFTELLKGIMRVKTHADFGHPSYLLGEVRWRGWRYFFIVALAVKTPLPFLLLTIIGLVFVVYSCRHFEEWRRLVPLVCATVILLICIRSPLNLGVTYILPIYPFFAILAGFAGMCLWRAKKRRVLWRTILGILLTWHFASSIWAHPDYLSYFNAAANGSREKILISSDLDWGQDLRRLSLLLKRLAVEECSIAYAGTADLTRHDLPHVRPLIPYQVRDGWIGISLLRLKVWPDNGKAFAWLDSYEPVAMAGRSIKVYNIQQSEVSKSYKANE